MEKLLHLVIFILNEQQYALHLSSVDRIVRIVKITPLPKAPDIVYGVVNLKGKIIPVINIRKRFRLPEREIHLSDHLIIAKTSMRTVALLADEVSRVVETTASEVIESEKILAYMDYVEGVVKLEDGLILIHDLDRFLSIDEEKALGDALMEIQG